MRFPTPLVAPARIAVTAPSSGVRQPCHPRLDLVISNLRAQGFAVEQGSCLREDFKQVSADPTERAAELMRFLADDSVAAVFPPWGGERGIDVLDLLDFDRIASVSPKWVMGFSDVSTLLLPLTLRTDSASAHGPNLMDLAPSQRDPLTTSVMAHLATPAGGSFTQVSSRLWQARWRDFAKEPDAAFDLTEPTRIECLRAGPDVEVTFAGRLIGGCLDTIRHLAGTSFGDVPRFIREHRDEGVILYFENCEMRPCDYARTLQGLRLAGWFSGIAGVIVGRTGAPDAKIPDAVTQRDALVSVLGDLSVPVLIDADIGHLPPQWLMLNGALATVRFANGEVTLRQQLA